MKQELADVKDIMITVESIRKCVSGMSNWKVPGPDGVQGFWFKRMADLHDRLVKHLQACLNTGIVPSWMTKGRTVLIMKDCKKGGVTGNYRPIACLPIMWKLLTRINGDEIYGHLERSGLLQNEKKGCRRGSRGTKDQLLIDKTILRNCRKAKRNLAIGFIDYKKAYDMVPYSWLKETLKMVGVANNTRRLLGRSMCNWKTVLTSNRDTLGEVSIQREIFQGDSLSPLLFIIILIRLSMTLNSTNYGYLLSKGAPINHLLFMDDLKLYGKTERYWHGIWNGQMQYYAHKERENL